MVARVPPAGGGGPAECGMQTRLGRLTKQAAFGNHAKRLSSGRLERASPASGGAPELVDHLAAAERLSTTKARELSDATASSSTAGCSRSVPRLRLFRPASSCTLPAVTNVALAARLLSDPAARQPNI